MSKRFLLIKHKLFNYRHEINEHTQFATFSAINQNFNCFCLDFPLTQAPLHQEINFKNPLVFCLSLSASEINNDEKRFISGCLKRFLRLILRDPAGEESERRG